jgi:acetamidase/formamidase
VLAHEHTVHQHQSHFGWCNTNPPVLQVAPGTAVEFQPIDASGGQLTRDSTVADISRLDFARVNPVTGPVYVDGAEPGDAIKVTILEIRPSGWGWTANIPGFGLLADQFPEPALQIWKYDPGLRRPALFGAHAKVPLKPFCGTIGLAPAEAGVHSVVPPRRVGGNMDIRDIGVGTELWLPVEVAGGLFSLGDTHAAQGDGEVCGTAIESPCNVVARLDLEKHARIAFPRFRTAGNDVLGVRSTGFDATTGIGQDLFQGARAAVSSMVDLLARRHGLRPVDAYMLCSVCGELRISEIVDVPNWVVSFYFPRAVFE